MLRFHIHTWETLKEGELQWLYRSGGAWGVWLVQRCTRCSKGRRRWETRPMAEEQPQ